MIRGGASCAPTRAVGLALLCMLFVGALLVRKPFLSNRDSMGIGTIIDHSNALNRKLEESISVGKEFEPIAGLWGRFTEVMRAAGIPDLSGSASASANPNAAASGEEGAAGTNEGGQAAMQQDGLRKSQGADIGLPPGVAPGGGIVYGRDA